MVLGTLKESANGSSHYKILQILRSARYCEMKKVRKLSCIVISVFLFMSLAACGNTAQAPDKAEDVSEMETPQESADAGADNAVSHENGERQTRDGFNGGGMGGRMQGGNGGGRGGNAGGMTNENDPEIQEVLDANADKFEQFIFEDAETGISLEYSLYIPEDYDSSGQYPLIMFIPDATGSGKSARQLVEQYYGAAVWVTEEEQQKHPTFVMVPAFTETVVDDNWNVSAQVETVVRLISGLQSSYSIDPDRIYTTGQSMGCMTSLYLNSKYPDLFAASMYVSGQWDVSVLKGMEDQKFFYITAGGDTKASGGQDDVMAMFDQDGVPYSFGTWNAQDGEEEQAAAAGQLLSLGFDANMVRFETGTVFKEGESGTEHMASFNYGYRLTAVRDWLFEQTK